MEEIVTAKGTIENIIYQNIDNGYCVFTIKNDISKDGENELTCVATMPKINIGETMELKGTFIVHATYGKQLKVLEYESVMPSTSDGIEKYLASGVIRGIGAKIAKKIVEVFGDDTLLILEDHPERLAKIRGISMTKALAIGEIFKEQVELRRVMIYLQGLGISPSYAQNVFKRYKEQTFEVVKSNPYALADEIIGIGFKIADAIAYKVGISQDSPYRLKAGVKYVLNQAASRGSVYLPKNILIDETSELLQISCETIEVVLMELQMSKDIWQEKIEEEVRVFLNYYYYSENYVAKKLIELSQLSVDKSAYIGKEIKLYESENNIKLAEKQKEAVTKALSTGVLVITGGPGTGKTTTVRTIIDLLQKDGLRIELAAPTGRAAKRMSEATQMEAKTIHRLLGIKFMSEESRRQTFEKDEDEPLEADVIIIDESSMIDIILMGSLLKAIATGTRLILLGDVDQLPSVGAGNVLKDILESDCITKVRLKEIFRQAKESAIVTNAHMINNGHYPLLKNNKDFFFMKRLTIQEVVDTIVGLLTKRLPEYAKCNAIKDIQVLTPMRKSALGVMELNKVLQQALNPPTERKREKEFRQTIFREGDKVMQIKNNYNMKWTEYDKRRTIINEGLGVFNGDEGLIVRISDEYENVVVLFDDCREVIYDYSQLEELDLSYAVTIHKSQGCEYKIVILPIHTGPYMLLSRNLLYTAVTRAKELAVIVGMEQTVYKMVDNDREINRYSSLHYRLRKMKNFFEQ